MGHRLMPRSRCGAGMFAYAVVWFHGHSHDQPTPPTGGRVIHWAFWYDQLLWVLTVASTNSANVKSISRS